MSLLDRLNLLIRSNLNDARSSSSDGWRGKMRDMESSLRDARRQLAELRASERQLVAQIRQARDKAEQWEDRAMMALRKGEEDLAREAIVVKNKTMREVERLREQLDDHRAYMRDIESSLEALEVKLEGTRGRLRADRANRGGSGRRHERGGGGERDERDWDAEMRRRMHGHDEDDQGYDGDREQPSSRSREHPTRSYERRERAPRGEGFETFDTDSTFREFDRVSNRISEVEAEIDAIRELSGDDWADPRRRELEETFRRMENNKRTDDDLSDLKRRFSED